MSRKPDTDVEVFNLGHWEALQLSLALDAYADALAAAGEVPAEHVDHTRDLGRVFGSGHAVFSIIKTNDPH